MLTQRASPPSEVNDCAPHRGSPGPGTSLASQAAFAIIRASAVQKAAVGFTNHQVGFPRSAGPSGGMDRPGIAAVDAEDAGGDHFGTPDQVQRHGASPVEDFAAASAGDRLAGLMTQPAAGPFTAAPHSRQIPFWNRTAFASPDPRFVRLQLGFAVRLMGIQCGRWRAVLGFRQMWRRSGAEG